MRALYQRRKGRDLFDLYKALTTCDLDIDKVLLAYNTYMDFVVEHKPTYKEFVLNMADKMQDDEFLGDTESMLRFGDTFDPVGAYEVVREKLIERLVK